MHGMVSKDVGKKRNGNESIQSIVSQDVCKVIFSALARSSFQSFQEKRALFIQRPKKYIKKTSMKMGMKMGLFSRREWWAIFSLS